MQSIQVDFSVIAGIVLSLFFEYVPGVATWYEALEKRGKQGVMALALLLVSAVYFLFGCFGLFGVSVACNWAGAEQVIQMFIVALISNQTTYLITRKG